MKELLLLSLMAIILVSGCIDFGGSQATFGLSEVTNNPDMYLKIRTSNNEIKSGRYVQFEFVIENRGDTDLENIKIVAYDQCMFTGNNTKDIALLRANRSTLWNWKWQARDTEFDHECYIKFRTTYNTHTLYSTTTNVLSESEYYTREDEGKLGEIQSRSSYTSNSLRIGAYFSEDQPFLTGERILLYINYNDVGGGLLKEIEVGETWINVTGNLANGDCSSYTAVTNGFVSSTPFRFVSKKAPSTTCEFTTNATQPIESGELRITANYKYQFDNSLLLKVIPS